MKILLIPLDYHKHESEPLLFTDLLDAFKKDHEAVLYDGNLEKAIDWKPDLVFHQGSISIHDAKKIKQETNCYWTMWTGDVRYAPPQSLVEFESVVNLYLLPFSGALLEHYKMLLCRPCKFIWEPLHNWKVIKPKELNSGKITFIGNIYDTVPGGEERVTLKEFLRTKVDDLIFTNGVPNNTLPGLYSDSFAVIAENNWSDIEDYFTPRNLLAMSNSCCLARYFPGAEWHFKNWEDCIYYNNKYELLDIINYLRSNPEIRNKIANKGHELMCRKYTYDNWVNVYIDALK